jgi:hypothetical protein
MRVNHASLCHACKARTQALAHAVPTVETAGISPITLRLNTMFERHFRPLSLDFQKLAASVEAGNPAQSPHLREPQREPQLEQQQEPLLLQPQREPPLKKQRVSRASRAMPGQHVQSDDNPTIASIWREYVTGLNGGPSLRALEQKGNKWRGYKGGRQKWHDACCFYHAIERRVHSGTAEVDAVAALQVMLDGIPKRGRSKKPNFADLRTELRKEEAGAAAAAALTTGEA